MGKKKPMPKAIGGAGSCLINGKIYIIGGFDSSLRSLSSVWEYDPNNETWIQKTDMPTPRDQPTIAEIEGKLYLMGGWNLNISTSALDTFDIYNPLLDKWELTQKMPYNVTDHVSGVVDKKIFLIGGMWALNVIGDDIYRSVWEYNPFPQPTTSISPKESLIGTWASIKTDK